MPLRRKLAMWAAVIFGGAVGLAVVSGTSCACVPMPSDHKPIPTFLGRTFAEVAIFEEDVRGRSGRYASSPADLAAVALPPETRIAAVSGSTHDFRVQLDSGSALSCVVSGGRTFTGDVRPFTLDCRRPAAMVR